MISIILYGRNDNYGYNLHKRAALSFNCMAELLEAEEDEILFVDYNTPNDFPTFPEAIQDTLSPRARAKLRILRVRPHVHHRFSSLTRLVALEPIARNVAVRRSNPANRWVLSTNTDMIFVPRHQVPLNEIVRDLRPGFYHAPRIEIPETLWEGLDRGDGRRAIETVREWGSALHINEMVMGASAILYDGPGDFQLIQRADLFNIQGFHEEMLLGWHVDSNIAKRLALLHGKVGDLGTQLFGYHCDHTRQITPAHSHSRTENDWRRFVNEVERPDIPEQVSSWGCPEDDIEEIRLTGQSTSAYINALKRQVGEAQVLPPVVSYTGEDYNKTDYDPRHVLPYLADMFVCCEKRINLGWFGARPDMLALFSGLWKDLGFTGDILVDEALVREHGLASGPGTVGVDFDLLLKKADAFVFEFGQISDEATAVAGLPRPMALAISRALLDIVRAEHLRYHQGKPPRQVVAVNAINSIFESAILTHLGAALTPFSTRMRHGFVLPPPEKKVDWTPRLQVGDAGVRDGSLIRSRPNAVGPVLYSPSTYLDPGVYRLKLKLSGGAALDGSPAGELAILEIMSQRNYLGHGIITASDLAKREFEMDIAVTEDQLVGPGFTIQTLLRTFFPVDMAVSGLTCEQLSDANPTEPESRALTIKEWLPLLWTGPGAIRQEGKIVFASVKSGIAFYGPCFGLPEGNYEAVFGLASEGWKTVAEASIRGYAKVVRSALGKIWRRIRRRTVPGLVGGYPLCIFQAISQQTELSTVVIYAGGRWPKHKVSLFFTVTPCQSADPDFALEFRLLAHGQLPFRFKSLTVQKEGS
jgi:hypothetical protein